MLGTGTTIGKRTLIYYSEREKKELLKSGKYVPQNHSSKPFNLTNFPAATTSIENGNKTKGATGH